MRILMFPADNTGCGYYRIKLPAEALVKAGHIVTVSNSLLDAYKQDYDLYIFQRVMTPQATELMYKLRSKGKRVVLDHDDDLYNLYPGHPSSGYFGMAKQCVDCGHSAIYDWQTTCPNCQGKKLQLQDRQKHLKESFEFASLITVSTPELVDVYRHPGTPIEVIPNYIDVTLYPDTPQNEDDKIIFGWAGSNTHHLDLTEGSHISVALSKYENAYLYVVGADPVVMEDKLGGNMPHERFKILNPTDTAGYPGMIKVFDVGLAPLVDNKFNRGKSYLKAMEYGAAWCPTIASDVAPYTRYIEHGKDGFLCKKPRDFVKYAEILLKDDALRHEMAVNARKKAEANDINLNINKRVAIYEALLDGDYDA